MTGKIGNENFSIEKLRAKNFAIAVEKSRSLGHELSEPKVGKVSGRIVAKCQLCSGLVYVLESGVAGGAASVLTCHADLPTAAGRQILEQRRQAAIAAARKPLRTPTKFTTPARPNTPTGVCEVCGNGTTLVGISCKKCGTSRRNVAAPRRRRSAPSVEKPPKLLRSGDTDYTFTKEQTGTFDAPCGNSTDRRQLYVAADWDGETDKPSRIVRFMCECRCIVRYD